MSFVRSRRAAGIAVVLGSGTIVAAGCAPPVEVPTIEAPPLAVDDRLLLAGDDAATPLLRHLTDHFTARHPGPAVVVEAPLGATGALRALADGALDAAIVVTPAATPAEWPAGTEARVIAETEAVLVTGAASGVRRIEVVELRALLTGTGTGVPRLLSSVLLAPAGEAAQTAIARRAPGLEQAFEAAIERRRWPVFFEGQARRDALRRTPGALAIADLGSLRLLGAPFWRVDLVGLAPDAPPARLEVRLVTRGVPRARLAELLRFLGGAEGQALLVDVGYRAP